MKRYSIPILLVAALVVAALPMTGAAQSTDVLFQEAQRLERVQGDYQGAIGIYQQIVGATSTERTSVARALVQMGKAYESLGRTEAFSVYERVVRDFADVDEQVSEARSRMRGLAVTEPVPGTALRLPGEVSQIPFHGEDARPYGVDLSPDGKYLAFTGGPQPFLQEIATGKNIPIPLASEDCGASTMRFTPDGRHIGYGCWGDAGVGIYDRESGQSRRILDGQEYFGLGEDDHIEVEVFDWTEEGDSLIVAIETFRPLGDQSLGTYHIILLPIDGGSPRVVDPDYYYDGNYFWENNACLMRDDRFLFGDWQFSDGDEGRTLYIQGVSTLGGKRQEVLYDENATFTLAGCDKEKNLLYYSAAYENMNTTLWGAYVEEDGSLSSKQYLADLPAIGWAWAHPFRQDGNLYYSLENEESWERSWSGRLTEAGVKELRPQKQQSTLDWTDDGRLVAMQNWLSGVAIKDTETGEERAHNLGHRFRPFAWFPDAERFMVSMWPFDDRADHAGWWDTRTWIYDTDSGALTDSIDGIPAFATSLDGDAVYFTELTDDGACVNSMKLADRSRTVMRCFQEATGLPKGWWGTPSASRSREYISLAYSIDDSAKTWRSRIFSLDGSVDYVLPESEVNRGIEFLPDDSGAILVGGSSLLLLDFESGETTEIPTGLAPNYSYRKIGWKLHPDGVQFETKLAEPDPGSGLWVIHNVAGLFEREK